MAGDAAVQGGGARLADVVLVPARFVVAPAHRAALGLGAGALMLGTVYRRGGVSWVYRALDAGFDAQWWIGHRPHPIRDGLLRLRSWSGGGALIGLLAFGALLEGSERLPLDRLPFARLRRLVERGDRPA